MGEVYRAWDTRLERHVAIKILNEGLAINERALSRFRTEAKAIAASTHPNILAIYDAELNQPPLFLVTELLEGETLRHTIQRSALPWRRTIELGAAVAEGLACAHESGIIHRDLKPENIFLTSRGNVKILNFGLAQFKLVHRSTAGGVTATFSDLNVVMGTVGYMSPEQVRGEDVTPATDVFSLACVLYEMLTGRRAFQRSTPASTFAAILTEEPSRIDEYVKDIPTELNRLISRCLEKDAVRRPQSARDLALVLRDASSGTSGIRHSVERGGQGDIESVAVLPFLTSSNSPDAEYLADGITESLINNLAQLSRLRVVARSTVFRHKGKNIDPLDVGRELNVQAVVTGRIFQRGEILVIAAELVNVRDGSQLWGQQYKRPVTDIFALEDELSHEISGRLRKRFAPHEHESVSRHYTENPEAYQMYLRGAHSCGPS
jgi:serine/threonine protein kinase